MNSHSEVIYKLMYGDKDTFRLAFALAGKSNFFEQVRCNPANQFLPSTHLQADETLEKTLPPAVWGLAATQLL